MSDLRSIKINSFYLISGQIAVRVFQIGFCVFLISRFGALQYGIFQGIKHAYIALVPLALLGFGPVLAYHIGKKDRGSSGLVRITFWIRFWWSLALTFVVIFTVMRFNPELSQFQMLLVFAPMLMLRTLINWSRDVYAAYEISRYYFIQVLVSNAIQVLTGLMVIALGGSLIHVAATIVAVNLAELIASFSFIQYRWKDSWEVLSEGHLKEYVMKSLPVGFFQVASRWMVLGPISVGQWLFIPSARMGAASFMVLNIFFVLLIYDSICRSWIAVSGRQGGGGRFSAMQSAILNSMLLATSAVAAAAIWLAPRFIYPMFGTDQAFMNDLLLYSCAALPTYLIYSVLIQGMITYRMSRFIAASALFGISVTTLSLLLLLEKGPISILISSVLGLATSAAVSWIGCRKIMLRKDRYITASVLISVLIFTAYRIALNV